MRYNYKVRYSEDEDIIVYRKFHYTPRQLGIRGFLATVFTALAIFILVPLPDDIFIIPAIAKGVQHLFNIVDFHSALVYSYAFYMALGLLFLSLALIFGAQYLRDAFFAKMKHVKDARKKMQYYAEEGHRTMKDAQQKVNHYAREGHRTLKRKLSRKR